MTKIASLAINYREAVGIRRCPFCYQYENKICHQFEDETYDDKQCSLFIINRSLEICKHCNKELKDHIDGKCENQSTGFVDTVQLDLF